MLFSKVFLKRIKSKNKWIPIERCGFPMDTKFLVFANEPETNYKKIYVTYYDDFYESFSVNSNLVHLNVSHWMPLFNLGNDLESLMKLSFKRNVYFLALGRLKDDEDDFFERHLMVRYKGSGEFVNFDDKTVIVTKFKILPKPPKTNKFLILEKKTCNKLFYQSAFS